MGFKRTSEGRIFFQSPEDSANDVPAKPLKATDPAPKTAPKTASKTATPPPSTGQTQMQIVTLLKTLNERLKITQAERDRMSRELETTRTLIEDLQAKSQHNEKAYRALQARIANNQNTQGGDSSHAEMMARDALQELEETRKMLAALEAKATRADRGVAALKKLQIDQAEKIAVSVNHAAALTKRVKDTEARQEQMGVKVEDALGAQARLSRKIDKAIEERTRFMRKLERIEETVLQTRDSLNAKAMVLLTDQGVAAQKGLDPHAEEPLTLEQSQLIKETAQAKPKTGQRLLLAASIAGLVLAAALSVATVTILQKQGVIENSFKSSAKEDSSLSAPSRTLSQTSPAPVDVTEMDWGIETDTSAFNTPESSRSGATVTAPIDPAQNDIGTLDLNNQAQVEAILEDNPDGVAAALNTIEPPNSLPDTIVPANTSAQTAPTQPPAKTAPIPSETKTAATTTADTPTQSAIQEKPLPKPTDPNGQIKPDSALPDTIKKIEAQAFEGIPEAQHDLAAIYTAGHGGVKQNYKRAAFWFEQAATRGIGNAAYNLGVLNHQGLGMSPDLDKAIKWYGHAATLGHPEAQYNLGIAYIEGIGVPYDAEKAAAYFREAASSGIMEAAYNLGLIYENGLLGQAQPDKALFWYKKSADAGSPEAKEALEQLAKSLNVSLDEVNTLAENVDVESTQNNASAPSSSTGSAALTAQIQDYLMNVGLYPGPADGIAGPLTHDAIRSYQRLNNLNPDGEVSEDLLKHMLVNTNE